MIFGNEMVAHQMKLVATPIPSGARPYIVSVISKWGHRWYEDPARKRLLA